MKKNLILLCSLGTFSIAYSQIGIHTENPQGMFHVDAGKDNASTGVPTVAQQANDVTILNDGKVGIGTVDPKQLLHIIEANSTSGLANSNSASLTGIAITGGGLGYVSGGSFDNWKGPGIYFENTDAPVGKKVAKLTYTQNNAEPMLNFVFANDDGVDQPSVVSNIMTLSRNGRVGINGVPTPQSNLSVRGNAAIGGGGSAPTDGLVVSGSTVIGGNFATPANRLSVVGTVVVGPAGSPYFQTVGPANGLAVTGSTGIGTLTPQKKLHVVGGLQITTDLNVGGTATTAGSSGTAGQILVSNGVNTAPSWQTPAAAVVNATAGAALERSGAGTTADPYTLGVTDQGITTAKIADNSVTYAKIATPIKNVITNYTLTQEDEGGFIYADSAAGLTIDVPDTLTAGFHCVIIQQGNGQINITGPNLTSARGFKTRTRYSAIGIIRRGPQMGTITGDAVN